MSTGRIHDVGVQVGSCPMGQILFRSVDRVLWTLESSVRWFMADGERNGPLVQPMNWFLFLPLLLCLRIFHISSSLITLVRGKETLSPKQVVSYIQSYRRNIRAMKYFGFKNYKTWKTARDEKIKVDGECIIVKMLGLYWLLDFTGLGRYMLPAPSLEAVEETQLKPLEAEHQEPSGTEQNTSKNIAEHQEPSGTEQNTSKNKAETGEESNIEDHSSHDEQTDVSEEPTETKEPFLEKLIRICEECNSEDDPDYDPSADKSDDSEGDSESGESSNMSTLSLETAEAGSESTTQTFYSSSNITPEPTTPQAPVEETYPQHSPDTKHAQENIQIEEKQIHDLPNAQNGNKQKQATQEGNDCREDSTLPQTSHPDRTSSAKENLLTDDLAQQNIPNAKQASKQSLSIEEKRGSDSSLQQNLPDENHKLEHGLSLEETSKGETLKIKNSNEQVRDQCTPVEERSDHNQTSSAVEESMKTNFTDKKQNDLKGNSNSQDEENAKTISDISNTCKGSGTVKTRTEDESFNPSENSDENLKIPVQNEQSSTNSTQNLNTKKSAKNSEFKELDGTHSYSGLQNESKEELKCLTTSSEASSKHRMPSGNQSTDFLNAERSAYSAPYRMDDPPVEPRTSSQSVKDGRTKGKPKRRLQSFFSGKKR